MARRNPFRSEAEAFRLVLLTIAGFAAIVAATLLGGWPVGLAVFVVVGALGVWWYLKPLDEESTQQASGHVHDPDERRILVIANETVAGHGAPRGDRADGRRPPCARARRHACAQHEAPALGVGRGQGPGRGSAAARGQPRAARGVRHRCPRSGGRCRPGAVDRRRATDVRRRRGDHLHAPGGPVQLARARSGGHGARAVRRADHARRGRPRARIRRA